MICSIDHVDRKTSIDLICKDTEEGRVDVMKTFGSLYVSALLVSTTTFFLCIRPYKYIQHCKSYFKNQNYIKGQLVSVLLCLDRVFKIESLNVRRPTFFRYEVVIYSFVRSFVSSFVRSFLRSFVHLCIHAFIHQSFTNF